MANVTMSIDDSLIKRARKAAIDRDSSLSDLFRGFLAELVERDEAKRDFLAEELNHALAASEASSESRRFSREELHER